MTSFVPHPPPLRCPKLTAPSYIPSTVIIATPTYSPTNATTGAPTSDLASAIDACGAMLDTFERQKLLIVSLGIYSQAVMIVKVYLLAEARPRSVRWTRPAGVSCSTTRVDFLKQNYQQQY
eukprot:scaffold10947_cov146-Skeletonema_dohrnii-CCMP3373.AAC.2